MREGEIEIYGLKVNYKTAGDGQIILILHGWGGSSDSWIRVQEILANRGYKVIVPDFPGFGKSKTPSEAWEVRDYTNFVNDFIKKTCGQGTSGVQNFFLLGHSFGGRVAAKFAASYPEKIKGLILCNSAGIKQKWGLKEKLIFQLTKIGNAIFALAPLMRFKDRARNLFYLFLRNKDYVKANGIMKETIKKVLNEDLLIDISQIKTKTLIIWGEKDKLVPVKQAYIFKEKIKNSELIVLPKISHSPHLETPAELSQIILNFIKQP